MVLAFEAMSEVPPPRAPRAVFRPRFTLTLVYLVFFFFLFGLIIALPDLLAGARELGPGPEELAPEELERAREITRGALAGGRLLIALGLAVIVTGLGSYARLLPGLRE
jgi:hypothetical protein